MDNLFIKLLLSALIIAAALFVASLLRGFALRFGERRGFDHGRIFQVAVLINATMALLGLMGLSLVWGFTGRGFVVFFSSIFALIGIALFASWSILSNVTAAVIVFFGAPYHIGDRIRVLDGDNTLTGRVRTMGFFYIGLEDEDGHIYTLPNNLLLQKTVIRIAEGKEVPCDQKHCR